MSQKPGCHLRFLHLLHPAVPFSPNPVHLIFHGALRPASSLGPSPGLQPLCASLSPPANPAPDPLSASDHAPGSEHGTGKVTSERNAGELNLLHRCHLTVQPKIKKEGQTDSPCLWLPPCLPSCITHLCLELLAVHSSLSGGEIRPRRSRRRQARCCWRESSWDVKAPGNPTRPVLWADLI